MSAHEHSTWTVEPFAFGNIVDMAIDGDQHTAVRLIAIVLLQLLYAEVAAHFRQLGFGRRGCGSAIRAALDDLVQQVDDQRHEQQIQWARDDFADDAADETLFARFVGQLFR